jgi:hypothetical protein
VVATVDNETKKMCKGLYMKTVSKTKLVILMTAMALPAAGFAQGHGVSGPDTHGLKTNTDELVLTRDSLKTILGNCMSDELLQLARTFAKVPNLQLAEFSGVTIHEVVTNDGRATSGSYLRVGNEFRMPTPANGDMRHQMYGGMGAELSGATDSRPPLAVKFDIISTDSGQADTYLRLNFYATSAPSLLSEESALPSGLDEYGNVIESKILVTRTQWNSNGAETLPLFNAVTHATISGVSFKQARYMQCVNLKLGKYAPVLQ